MKNKAPGRERNFLSITTQHLKVWETLTIPLKNEMFLVN